MPYSVSEEKKFLRFTVTGAVTGSELRKLIDDSESMLKERAHWPNTLLDMRGIELSGLGLTDMLSLSKRRVSIRPPNPIRTAFVADSATVSGFVRMFQNLNRDPAITTELFEDVSAAEKWLAAK